MLIISLMAREELSRETVREAFSDILFGDQPDLHKGAFLAALRMKGETVEEIAGCFDAIYNLDTNKVKIGGDALVDNCGTGMDSLKTFNISTLSAIVAASMGVRLARHGASAITSRCGTVDLCRALGVDVDCDVGIVSRSVETCGLGLFNGMSPKVHPGGLGRILSQIRFGTTLNIAASLANPALPSLGARGVGSPGQIGPTIEVMRRIGYRKAVVYHGWDEKEDRGMDELSTLGKSRLGILKKDGNVEYLEVYPEEAGLTRGNYDEIRPMESVADESVDALRTLAGGGRKSRTDIVAFNTGVILWLVGKSLSLRDGVQTALEEMRSGRPLKKLVEWVSVQNRNPRRGRELIAGLCAKAGVN
jgi:anthranilate phosphoribosyltransferase